MENTKTPWKSYLAMTQTDLPVMKPFQLAPAKPVGEVCLDILSQRRFCLCLLAVSLAWISVDAAIAQSSGGSRPSALETILRWTPLIFFGPSGEVGGFLLNILVSFMAMAIGTFLGLWLGIGQISLIDPVRKASWLVTQIFRNSPWLVLLFFFMLLLPYEVEILGKRYEVPGWAKATFALSLPVMANVSEIVRGAIASLPTGQWESAESLAFSRRQTIWSIILPQCVKRMLPPWMNWYCILTMSTPLISILGVNDSMALTQNVMAAEDRSEILIPLYLWLMSWFFLYSYPIAVLTRRLERRFAVKQ
ncbi:amino acid ABC transporter permease [Paracoccus sp. MKU1]|uniref:amino acid ABC transporter permease n=1 Tax=Paracoccus sp. MKU1 TaxID=1745182 RepID=UPI000B2EEB5C|nr:ABC transporter permease subunit [Paracoccus sp. MKU1]